MKRLVALLLLLPVCSFGEVNPSLDSIRIAVFNQLGIPSTGTSYITEAKANQKINYGIQEIETSFPAYELFDTVTVDSSAEGGALPTDFVAIKWCQFMLGDTLRVPLEYLSEDSLSLFSRDKTALVQHPGAALGPRYYYTHHGRLMTFPKWRNQSAASYLIAYYAVESPLTSGTDSTDMSPGYHDELINFVCGQIEAMRQNYDGAAYYQKLYESAVNKWGFKK